MGAATDHAHAAWQHYLSEGTIVPQLLRPGVLRAWQLAHASHVNPAMSFAPTRRPQDTEQVVAANEELVTSARVYLDAASTALAKQEHAALLGTADGTLVSSRAQGSAARRCPGPGALMGESSVGANGIGTALAQRDYVEVVGHEHFIRGFHQHHCQGLPIWAPDGKLVGALCLSISLHSSCSVEQARKLVLVAAKGIEAELRAGALKRTLQRLRAESSREVEPLERLHQDVVQSQTSARLQMEIGARHMGRGETDSLFDDTAASLRSFMRTSALWHLASSPDDIPAPGVGIHELAASVVELLQTEARMQGVTLSVASETESAARPLETADRWTARRVLLEAHHLLRAVAHTRGRVVLHWSPRELTWHFAAFSERGVVVAERRVRLQLRAAAEARPGTPWQGSST